MIVNMVLMVLGLIPLINLDVNATVSLLTCKSEFDYVKQTNLVADPECRFWMTGECMIMVLINLICLLREA